VRQHLARFAQQVAAGIAFIPYGPLGANPMQHGAKLAPGKALGWLLQRPPNVVVIPGTTEPDHARDNVGAMMGRLPDASLRSRMEAFYDAL